MAYWEFYLLGIILLPGIILATWAQIKVSSTYKKYSEVIGYRGLTGADVAKEILTSEGILDVEVLGVGGSELSDHYNSKTKKINLSQSVYAGTSIAALGVAAHEAGHAIQDAKGYKPLKLRSALAKASTITSSLLWPLVIMGIIFNFAYVGGLWGQIFLWAGCAFFGISVIFSLITLPVEYNASNRALKLLVATGCVDDMEVQGAKQVLNAAALTYVAALIVSILSLLRFVLFFFMNSRNRE